jgi:hypothetical protein
VDNIQLSGKLGLDELMVPEKAKDLIWSFYGLKMYLMSPKLQLPWTVQMVFWGLNLLYMIFSGIIMKEPNGD